MRKPITVLSKIPAIKLAGIAFFCLIPLWSWAGFSVRVITDQLSSPWGMAQLPDGRFLVTEKRAATLRIVDLQGNISAPVSALPEVDIVGQGGLLDVTLHPQFPEQPTIYLSFTSGDATRGHSTEVVRANLLDIDTAEPRLTEVKTIFEAQPKVRGGRHFGGRLLFDRQNFLFISLGDRGQRAFSQRLDSHHGSVIRLHDDGRVPIDNPFVNQPGARPEIFTYGHRNVQGMTLHPQTDEVWIHEHGPQGGDEVNLLQAGKNYGWPVITYGVEYVSGLKIGEGIRKPGMEQPLHFWDPSIAPSGMAFYRGDLWVGALKYQLLAQLTFKEDLLLKEQRHFQGRFGRIRDVRNFSDDRQQPALYLLTGASNGQLIRIDYD